MAVAINTELLRLYWRMGADICEKQKSASWGDGWLKDQFYNEQLKIGQQVVAQLDDVNMQQLVAQLQDKDFKKSNDMENKDNIPQFVNSDSFMADKNYVK